jgi:hypothetical protein
MIDPVTDRLLQRIADLQAALELCRTSEERILHDQHFMLLMRLQAINTIVRTALDPHVDQQPTQSTSG